MEKIAGISFIDKFINKNGLPWCIKCVGYILIVSGCFGLIIHITFPLWKEQLLSKWRNDNLPLLLPLCAHYSALLLAPLKLITGIGLLRFRQWGRILFVFISAYSGVEIIATLLYKALVILPRYNKTYTYSALFGAVVGLFVAFTAIRIFVHPKVKEQFK
ncbi:MAG: hypothetical protein Q8O22_06050 [Candidatus Omnitrophota bacterium]|nr:hypothetical protein [Candidatus Omnitrophota bacterium]